MHGAASVMGCVMVQIVTWVVCHGTASDRGLCHGTASNMGGCVLVQPVTWGVCHGTASNMGGVSWYR